MPGSSLEVENIRFSSLADFFALSQDSSESHEYSVAWIDCLAHGRALGRGHFTRASHAVQPADERPGHAPAAVVDAADATDVTGQPAHPAPVQYALLLAPAAQRRRHVSHLLPFFYPLDGISQWNRMYGPAGFVQYQCVLPPHAAADGIPALLQEIARSGQGSFLAVLKQFGTRPSLGMLSFPRPGTTLALDFPNTGEALWALLRRLDQIVDAAGGAQYPARMRG